MMELNQLLDGMTEEELRRLMQQQGQGGQQFAPQQAAPMQLADLSGLVGPRDVMSRQHQMDLQRMTGDTPPQAAPSPGAWSGGADSRTTQDWRTRQAPGQAAERERLMRIQRERARMLQRAG